MKRGLVILGIWAGITGANVVLLSERLMTRVPVEVVHKTPLMQVVRAPGSIEPKQSLTLKAEFDGPVVSKSFKEGSDVKKGQLLLEVGRDKIRLEHETKSIALENAKADLARARKEARLQKDLFAKGAVAYSSVDDATRAVVRAVQGVKTAQEDFLQTEEKWRKNKIYATFDGSIIKDNVGLDPSVSAGKDIAILADVSEYSVVAKVDELEIGQIKPGQQADIRLQAYSQMRLAARVTEIGSQAEANGLTEVPVTLILQKIPDVYLRPKLTAIVHIITGQYGQALSVPLTALSNATGTAQVYVVDTLNRIHLRKVLLGQSNPERVEVKQGLSEGERICTVIDPKFADGIKIKVKK